MKIDIIDLVEQAEREFGTSVIDVLDINKFASLKNDGVYTYLDGKVIKLTTTGKIVIRDMYTCKDCGSKVKYAVVLKNENAKMDYYNVAFYTHKKIKNEINFFVMTKDHIIPKSLGGADRQKNFQLLCVECNAKKADTIDNLSSGLIKLNPAQVATAVKDQKRLREIEDRITKASETLPWYLRLLKVHKILQSLLRL